MAGTSNECCGVGDRWVSDGVVTSKADGEGVVYGVTEDEDGVALETDVDGAGARSGDGIGNNYGHVGDRFASERRVGHGGM